MSRMAELDTQGKHDGHGRVTELAELMVKNVGAVASHTPTSFNIQPHTPLPCPPSLPAMAASLSPLA